MVQKTETRRQDGQWHRRFKTVQGSNRSKDRKIELISKKDWRKRKGVQKMELIHTWCNIDTVAEEVFFISENIATLPG